MKSVAKKQIEAKLRKIKSKKFKNQISIEPQSFF